MIWIQTVRHSGGISERFKNSGKNLQMTEKHVKLPSMQKVKVPVQLNPR